MALTDLKVGEKSREGRGGEQERNVGDRPGFDCELVCKEARSRSGSGGNMSGDAVMLWICGCYATQL